MLEMLECIVESTPNHSKKDCMKRYKVSLYVGDAWMHRRIHPKSQQERLHEALQGQSVCWRCLNASSNPPQITAKKTAWSVTRSVCMLEMLECIVESTPNHSKKDCMKRYKVSLYVGDAWMHRRIHPKSQQKRLHEALQGQSVCWRCLNASSNPPQITAKKTAWSVTRSVCMLEMLECIVESTPNHSKKDCMKCYKVSLYVGDAWMHRRIHPKSQQKRLHEALQGQSVCWRCLNASSNPPQITAKKTAWSVTRSVWMLEMLECIVESIPNHSKKDCTKCCKVRVYVKLLVCDTCLMLSCLQECPSGA